MGKIHLFIQTIQCNKIATNRSGFVIKKILFINIWMVFYSLQNAFSPTSSPLILTLRWGAFRFVSGYNKQVPRLDLEARALSTGHTASQSCKTLCALGCSPPKKSPHYWTYHTVLYMYPVFCSLLPPSQPFPCFRLFVRSLSAGTRSMISGSLPSRHTVGTLQISWRNGCPWTPAWSKTRHLAFWPSYKQVLRGERWYDSRNSVLSLYSDLDWLWSGQVVVSA